MKKSVKILSIVLALVIVIGCFAACGGKEEPKDETKVLVMATNAAFPPYEYVEGGEFVVNDGLKLLLDALDVLY